MGYKQYCKDYENIENYQKAAADSFKGWKFHWKCIDELIPEGPTQGHAVSEETKKKMSKAKIGNTATKGRHWYNNGKENKFCYECPEGYKPGKLLINKGN